jgi:hypothetical protein
LGAVSPHLLQVLAFSATYTDTLLAQLRQLMNAPQEVLLCPQTVALQGACAALLSACCLLRLTRMRSLQASSSCTRRSLTVSPSCACSSSLAFLTLLHATAGNTVALLCGKEAALMRILSTLTFNQVRLLLRHRVACAHRLRAHACIKGARVLQPPRLGRGAGRTPHAQRLSSGIHLRCVRPASVVRRTR